MSVTGHNRVNPLFAKFARFSSLLPGLCKGGTREAAQPHLAFDVIGLAIFFGEPDLPGGEPEQPRSPNLSVRAAGGVQVKSAAVAMHARLRGFHPPVGEPVERSCHAF